MPKVSSKSKSPQKTAQKKKVNLEREGVDLSKDKKKKNKSQSQKIITKEPSKTLHKEAKHDEKDKRKKNINKIKKYPSMYRGIAYFFIFLVILLVGVIFYFTFSGVKIIIIPSEEKIKNNLTLNIYDSSQENVEGQLKGLVGKMEISSKDTYKASGQKILSESVVGKVTVINNYNKDQPLIATTRLLTPDDKLFRIKKTINVPAGGKAEVEIYADKPGENMLIEPTKFTIPGLWSGLQDKIYALSEEATRYEKSGKIFITQKDIDEAVESEKKKLIEKAKKEAENKYNQYDYFFYDLDKNSISQNIAGEVDEERDELKVEVMANVMVVAFNKDEALELVEEKFQSLIPSGKKPISFSENQIEYSLSQYSVSDLSALVVASFEGRVSLKAESDIVDKKQLAGLTEQQLKKYLDSLPEIAGYEIKFYPSFIKRIPMLPERIKIEVKTD